MKLEMNDVTEGKVVGYLIVICGIMAIVSGSAGLTLYGRLDGSTARIVGCLMLLLGLKLIFPVKWFRK